MIRLTVKERAVLFGIIPRQGSFIDMDLAQQIIEQIRFLPEERETIELVNQGEQGIGWNEEKAAGHEIELDVGLPGARFIADSLTKMSDAGELPVDAVSLWQKFVDPGPAVVEIVDQEK